MSYLPEEIMQYIEEENVKFIRMAFRDAFGVQKNISVLPAELKKAFNGGIPIGSSEIAGFEDSGYSHLYLCPDPETLAVLPWRSDNGTVIRMYCDVYTPDKTPFVCDTRNILKEACRCAEEAGIEFRFGNESEFYLFKKDSNLIWIKAVFWNKIQVNKPFTRIFCVTHSLTFYDEGLKC